MKKIKNIKLLLVALLAMFGMDAFAQVAIDATNAVYKDNLVYVITDPGVTPQEVMFYGVSANADPDERKIVELNNEITALSPSTGKETTYKVVGFYLDDYSAPVFADGWADAKGTLGTDAWATIDMSAEVEEFTINLTVKELTAPQVDALETLTAASPIPASVYKDEAWRPLTDAWTALKKFTVNDMRGVEVVPDVNTGLSAQIEEINIPGVKNDEESVTIPDGWVKDFGSLVKVTLPQNHEVIIGEEAFRGCWNLATVVMGTNAEKPITVGPSAFRADIALTSIDLTRVKKIDEYAFAAAGLKDGLTITANVEEIGEEAFAAGTSPALTSVTFSSTKLKKVPAVFTGQTKITKVTVTGGENSATEIAAYAFSAATAIEEIDLSAATALKKIDNAFAPTGLKLKKVSLRGSGLTAIPFAVAGNADLTDFTFPAGLTGVLRSFNGCTALKNLGTIPDGVTGIPMNGFADCVALEEVDFDSDASGLLTIGDMAFQDDVALKSFAFAKTKKLQSIGVQAFENCQKFKSADLSATMVKTIGNQAFRMKTNAAGEYLTALTTVTLPDLTEVKDPADDTKEYTETLLIGQGAFQGCAKLTAIGKLGQKKIKLATGGYQFAQSGLTGDISFAAADQQVKDGDDLVYQFTEIPGSAFYNVKGITSITLPVGLSSIASYAFFNCEALATVTYGNIEALASIGSHAFDGCALTTVDLSGADGRNADDTDYLFKTINPFTFANNKSLTTVKLPSQINWIAEGAFCDDVALTSINLDETDISVLNNIFTSYVAAPDKEISLDKLGKKDNLLILEKKDDIKLNIAGEERGLNPLLYIDDYALQFTGIEEITIPESVTTMGDGAFRACTSLKKFTWLNAKQNFLPVECFRGDVNLEEVWFLTTETATGDGLDDEAIFTMCNKEKLTVYVTLDSYNAAVAAGQGNENRKYSKLEVKSNRVFQFTESNLAADEYYYATYYNPDNSSWFDPEVFDVYSAVIDGSKIVLKKANVVEGFYKVAKLNIKEAYKDDDLDGYANWDDDKDGLVEDDELEDHINAADAICVVRSKDINAKPQLNSNDGSEYKTTLPTDNDLQYCFYDGYAGGSRLNFVYKFGKNKKSGKVAFFRITTGDFKEGAVYVESVYGTARGLNSLDVVVDGESTGIKDINTVEENTESAPIYNLQGVRVNKAGKGLFIQNGKKILK